MITYEEYKKEGFDTRIKYPEFQYIVRIVKRKVNAMTFNRFNYKNTTHIYHFNEIVLTVCQEIISNKLYGFLDDAKNENKTIKAETIGQQRVEYAISNDSALSSMDKTDLIDKRIKRIIKEELAHTGLLYRGRYRGKNAY